MLGLLFTILTYGLVTAICFLIKTVFSKLKKSKPKTTAQNSPSKIYYIQNSPKRKKSAIKKPNIAIKGSVISEISEEEINAISEEN